MMDRNGTVVTLQRIFFLDSGVKIKSQGYLNRFKGDWLEIFVTCSNKYRFKQCVSCGDLFWSDPDSKTMFSVTTSLGLSLIQRQCFL